MLVQNHLNKAGESIKKGSLYVVATPIGHLGDITLRALSILEKVDLICAEDTRIANKLLSSYGIRNKIISLREQNEMTVAEKVVTYLKEGQSIAQISDAGTPTICDPGYRLVSFVREQGFEVFVVPGASAIISALSISGLPSDQFYFNGFLPSKQNARLEILKTCHLFSCPIVFYETPHRIEESLKDFSTVASARKLILMRELTKTFETVLIGSPSTLLEQLKTNHNQSKGEMVLIWYPKEIEKKSIQDPNIEELIHQLKDQLPTKKIAELLSNISGISKNELYEKIIFLKK